MINKKKRFCINIISYLLLIPFAFVCVLPFYWMILFALKPDSEIRSAFPSLITRMSTLKDFIKALYTAGFLKYIKNSFLVSIIACFASMVIAVMAGYASSRYYKERMIKIPNLAMLVFQMIPDVLLLVPPCIIMRNLGFLKSYISLTLSYTMSVIPFCTFMMSSFFNTVSITLEEAAEIDGTNKLQMMVKIILPISIPSLVSTGLYALIQAWNEFVFGYIFISTDQYRTLTSAIMPFKGSNIINWGGLMAASVVVVLPIICLLLFTQKYFLSGLMSGSVKR